MKGVCVLVSCLSLCSQASGQNGIITTVAGSNWVFPSDVTIALNAPLGRMVSVAVDAQGNLYAADASNNIVVRVTPAGALSVVAGNGSAGFSGDGGPATSASLTLSSGDQAGVAVDSAGNLFIGDAGNQRVRKVSVNGVITTVAGSGRSDFAGDGGPATSASLGSPTSVAVDGYDNLFILDRSAHRVRKVSAGGVITTVAGNGTAAFSGDGGQATSASLYYPCGIALDQSGNLFISEIYNRVRKVSAASGVIATVAGNGTFGFSGDGGRASSAVLNEPFGLAVDAAGNLFIADSGNNRIRKVSASTGVITTVAGVGEGGGLTTFAGDGEPATSAWLNQPFGLAVDASGNLFIADSGNDRIRKVAVNGVITTVAGNGVYRFSGDGGPASSAQLRNPAGVAVDAFGNLFIADCDNKRIRKVSPGGLMSTFVGNGTYGFSGDGGPATAASLRDPWSVAVDAAGNLFIADLLANRIRKVSASTGVITTVAGNGGWGLAGDGGPATSASLNYPYGVAVDASGNLFIADEQNHAIRKVSPSGVITRVAGNGTAGYSGNGGPATSAQLNSPNAVAVDASGNLFIADSQNFRVRKVSASGVITTVAGNGSWNIVGEGGPATSAGIGPPAGIAVDSSGNLFIAGSFDEVRMVASATGMITTVAGGGTGGLGDGGPASSAILIYPVGLAFDGSGNLFIADTGNNRIRKVTLPSAVNSGPSITPGGVVPVYSTVSTIQPGEWVSIYGRNLATSTATAMENYPTTLSGTSVTINGKAGYLWYVSPTQINLQAPSDTATGSVPVVVTTPNGTATSTVTLAQFGPSFSLLDSKHVAGIILRSNGSGAYGGGTYDIIGPMESSFGYPTVAAKAGDALALFAVGLGPTNPPVPAGQAFSGAAPTTNSVNLLINNVNVIPSFAGLTNQGLYQINLTVPAGLGTGDVSLVATVGGVRTPSGVVISLQPAAVPPRIQNLTLSPTSVASGGTVTGSVVLSAVAPSGGAVVALSSSSSTASVPATVTVPAGGTTATFIVSAGTVSANQTVTITASYGGTTAQAILTVGPPSNSQCTNISGNWSASESGSMTLTIAVDGEADTETDPLRGNGSVTIAQSGCSIQYDPIGIAGLIPSTVTPSQLASLRRNGTVSGTDVSITGIVALIDTVAGAQNGLTITDISSNNMTGTGRVTGNVITLTETGNLAASGTYSIEGHTGSFTLTISTASTATFSWGSGVRPTLADPPMPRLRSDAVSVSSMETRVVPDRAEFSPVARERIGALLRAALRQALVFSDR